MRNKKTLFILICMILMTSAVYAENTNTMTLLAVKETNNGLVGGTATLSLEVNSGKGRVFLETSPLTKIDTQVSTRFAKEIACKTADLECSSYDFIYTVKSDAPIIGGPSAGAAMGVLTLASVKGAKCDQKTAITGTINSGGIIGAVGGVKEKIDAAKTAGLTKVLVPLGENLKINETENATISPEEYGNKIGMTVKEVGTLNEAYKEFTGQTLQEETTGDVEIDSEYIEIMKNVAEKLCNRSEELVNSLKTNETKEIEAKLNTSKTLFNKTDYYSAASLCFSSNVRLGSIASKELTNEELAEKITRLASKINEYDKIISRMELKTMPQLQTYMIVKERINEAEDYLNKSISSNSSTELRAYYYAYSEERLNSAISWSAFFKKKGVDANISKEALKESCTEKISEADDRMQYVLTLYPAELEGVKDTINNAKKYQEKEEYALCINAGALAKADVDSIISTMGATDEASIKKLIELKLKVAKANIIKKQSQGFFPIAGYSYYEYSKNLMEDNVYSSLLFSQYALELSSFDFKTEKTARAITTTESKKSGYEYVLVYIIGIITGVILTYMVIMRDID
jgi:uncharacterized protein